MKEIDVKQLFQRAREKFPGVKPRIISDNGPQFIAKDFKAFIRLCAITSWFTGPTSGQLTVRIQPAQPNETTPVTAIVSEECGSPCAVVCQASGHWGPANTFRIEWYTSALAQFCLPICLGSPGSVVQLGQLNEGDYVVVADQFVPFPGRLGCLVEEWQGWRRTQASFHVYSRFDVDRNDFVDWMDHVGFPDCFSGPTTGNESECNPYDFDSDGDVDLGDWSAFQNAFAPEL